MLLELQDSSYEQIELNLEQDNATDRSKLITKLDVVNQRFGRGALHIAISGVGKKKTGFNYEERMATPD